MPTRKSWPIRWASVIVARTWSGQDADDEADGKAAAPAAAARDEDVTGGEALAAVLAALLAADEAGWPPETRPQPAQARLSAAARAGSTRRPVRLMR